MMSKKQYRRFLERWRMTQEEASTLFGYADRSGRRWCNEEARVPSAVAILVRGLQSRKFTIEDVERWRDADGA